MSDERGNDGGVCWVLLGYRTIADVNGVRAHYRAVFREHGWFVGEVDYQTNGWRFVASRGSREVVVEITPDDTFVQIVVWVSDTVQQRTPEPTAHPERDTEPADEDDAEQGDPSDD